MEIALTIFFLSIMEISLSFDNAVVNATVLRQMSEKWQQRFLTWGIFVAVFGMRLLFPILIVSVATGLSMLAVGEMALNDAALYGEHLHNAHLQIASFGGLFLLMVFLNFLCDDEKEVHWLPGEQHLSTIGKINGLPVVACTVILMTIQYFVPMELQHTCLVYGLIGVVLYILMHGIMDSLHVPTARCLGLAGFMYLEVLDAAFSLDGVIGAFAMSNNIFVIMTGLAIGAFCIRSLTIYLVRKGTLTEFIYLEHGAYWGIGSLAFIMLAGIFYPVHEVITGLIGVSFIGLSLLSSIAHRKKLV